MVLDLTQRVCILHLICSRFGSINSAKISIMNKYSSLPGGKLAALSIRNGQSLADFRKGGTPKQFRKLAALAWSQERRAERLLGLRAINW